MQLLKNYMSAAAFRQQFFSSIPIYACQTFGFLLGCRITVNPINYFSNTCSSGKTAQRHKLPWTYCLPWFLHDAYDGCMTMACERFSKDGQNFNCPPAQDTTHSKGLNTFLHLLRQTVSNLPWRTNSISGWLGICMSLLNRKARQKLTMHNCICLHEKTSYVIFGTSFWRPRFCRQSPNKEWENWQRCTLCFRTPTRSPNTCWNARGQLFGATCSRIKKLGWFLQNFTELFARVSFVDLVSSIRYLHARGLFQTRR